jgi:hypothetical protein
MSIHSLFQAVATYGIQQNQILKQTTYLFLKALIIGLLVNLSLQHVGLDSVSPERNGIQFELLEQRQPLKQAPATPLPDIYQFDSP